MKFDNSSRKITKTTPTFACVFLITLSVLIFAPTNFRAFAQKVQLLRAEVTKMCAKTTKIRQNTVLREIKYARKLVRIRYIQYKKPLKAEQSSLVSQSINIFV